ncbi:MAG: VTT domain-containing protein [Thermodesulfovibrionales bacterium]|nr:VTT domain-containing protein [Thermodesulfovibrionales bacterium]
MSQESIKTGDFLTNCNSCGKCKKACPFLEKCGTPDMIISKGSEDVFLCTNCRACNILCPLRLLPSDAILSTRHRLIKENRLSENIKDSVKSANAFARKGHRFPFSYYERAEIIFWPGCALSGTEPDIIKKTIRLLNKHLNCKVGIVLDCCFDSSFQIGDIDEVQKAAERIRERLRKHGIRRVITGCVNCKKIFSLYLPEISAEHIMEVLSDTHSHIYRFTHSQVYLHHPCPSYMFEGIQEKARNILKKNASDIIEPPYPSCCGLGGGLHDTSKELSDTFAGAVITDAGNRDIITYCMGCKNKFLKNGKRTSHILEFMNGIKPIEEAIPSQRKWLNRFLLAMHFRLKGKSFISGLILIILILATTFLRKTGHISLESIIEFIEGHSVTAPLLFILIYAIGPSLFISSLALTLGAGFIWGPFMGVVFSITGATIGASVSFLLARYIIGNAIKERFTYTVRKRLGDQVAKHGWKAVAFARLIPIFPFPVLNYLFGVTPIPFIHYLWSTFVFMLPACIAYVAFGSSMGELIISGNIKGIIIGIVIASAAMLLPLALKPKFKEIFQKNNGR